LLGILFTFGVVWAREMVVGAEFNRVTKEARAGDVGEQLRLAMLYDIGKFTDIDKEKAVKWYEKAAQNGSRTAQDILCWDYGKGCEK